MEQQETTSMSKTATVKDTTTHTQTRTYRAKRKPNRPRTAFTESQVGVLKAELAKDSALCLFRRKEISDSLRLPKRTIKIWFQNRRQDKRKNRGAYVEELSTDDSGNDDSFNSVKTPGQSEHSQDEIETPTWHQSAYVKQQETIPQTQPQRESHSFRQDLQHISCHQDTPQQQISQQQSVKQPVEDCSFEFNADFCQKFMAEADYFRSLDAYASALFSELTTSFTKEDYDELDIYLCYPVI